VVSSGEAPIEIAEHDPAWSSMFAAERSLLERTLAPWLGGAVEHIGSTAVPGLAAKPVIDIMAPVASLEASRDAIDALRELDYHYAPYRSEVMHWFCKPGPSLRTHHLHLVPYRSELWEARIAFRDCLRSNPRVAAQYVALKRDLALAHCRDREAYTEAKGAFIVEILRQCAILALSPERSDAAFVAAFWIGRQ
jgi:GrpB-like predicted nucleotidyltransferase (UPF0157 family)